MSIYPPNTTRLSILLILCLLFAFVTPETARAYEEFSQFQPILKCQTGCHKAENIAQAKHDKLIVESCRECHAGDRPAAIRSPFRPPERFFLSKGPRLHLVQQPVSPPSPAATKHKPPKEKYPGMVFIPSGNFIMGSNERWDDESPEHLAKTDALYIDIHEVTNADYEKFIREENRETPYHWADGNIPKGKENHPVVYVNWFDADNYCRWAGKRLPTEQEWEKAARGENGNIYPWGNVWSLDKSNNPYKHSTGTEPIMSYPEGESVYGLYDMSGNVWEWVDSYYLPHPGNTIPRTGYGRDKRVLKGGSWFDCLSYGCGLSAPTFNRSFFTPEVRNNSFGFRCAKSP